MNKLLDEEIEQDDLFWNQDALKEVVTISSKRLFLVIYIVCVCMNCFGRYKTCNIWRVVTV